MKIITDIEQGSQEWLNLRLGKITASQFSKIITRTGQYSKQADDIALKLASEIYLNYADESYSNAHMKRGVELEPEARIHYAQETLTEVNQVAFIDCGDYGYSPDGLIGNDGLLEIKCPTALTHFQYIKNNIIPDEYYAQCQGGLMVSNRQWIDFVSYHPDVAPDKQLFIKRCYRDEEFISSLKYFIDLTIQKRNQILLNNIETTEENSDNYAIEEVQDSRNSQTKNILKIEDIEFISQVEKYMELQPIAEEFEKIKKIVHSKTEAIHLANDVIKILDVNNYEVVISYTNPKIYDEKLIDKEIDNAKEKLECALNLQVGEAKSTPKFKCKIIKK